MTDQQEREAFERWLAQESYQPNAIGIKPAWDAWQARAAMANASMRMAQEAADKRYEERTPTQWAYDQACKALEQTKQELARATLPEGMRMEWQSIETAPKDGTCFLGCVDGWHVVTHWHRGQLCWATCGPSYDRLSGDEMPTHWQPLPAAPQQPAEKG